MNAAPHVVLKRGHRGRYRFTVMTGDATVSGRVQVDPAVTDREQAGRLVRRKILELAGIIALWVETGSIGEDAGSAPKATVDGT